MTLAQPGKQPLDFMSSPESCGTHDKELLNVRYSRVQQESPDFTTVFEGIEQQVDVELSTFIFRASPEPLIDLYDFVMSAFVSKQSQVTVAGATMGKQLETANDKGNGKIRVKVQLESVQGMC